MKQLIFSLLLLTACGLQAFAQQELIHPKERQNVLLEQKGVLVQRTHPYIQIDGKQIAQQSLVLLAPENIGSVEVYKDENATAKFGDKAKDGAVVIKTVTSIKLANIQDIYTKYGIPAAQQNLKVVINNQLVKDPSLILANLKQIEKVEIMRQDIFAPVRWSLDDEEEFLHISSKPQPKK